MKEIVKSYFIEAKWFIEGYMPPFEEYMSNALITSTYFLLTTTSLLGMKSATKKAFDWLIKNPKTMIANVTICRVVDDVATYEVSTNLSLVTKIILGKLLVWTYYVNLKFITFCH